MFVVKSDRFLRYMVFRWIICCDLIFKFKNIFIVLIYFNLLRFIERMFLFNKRYDNFLYIKRNDFDV